MAHCSLPRRIHSTYSPRDPFTFADEIEKAKLDQMTRRTFTKSLGSAVVLTALDSKLSSLAAEPKVAAASLYHKSFVLDCNTLASIGTALTKLDPEELTRQIHEAGVTVAKSTLGGATGNFEEAIADIAAADQLVEKRADLFLKIRVPADLERAQKERKLGIIYSFEAANMLEDKVERVELFRQLGVRVMQLIYNRRSPFGVGCLDGETGGVTDLGRKAIVLMNKIGVALGPESLERANDRRRYRGFGQASGDRPRKLSRHLPASTQQGGSRDESTGG